MGDRGRRLRLQQGLAFRTRADGRLPRCWSRCCRRSRGRGGRPRRRLIDGIRFRVRTGVPWWDVPVGYGPWGRVYDLFRRWQREGVWHRVLARLQSLADAKGAIVWDLSVDSTVCRAHQRAAGARRQGDPAEGTAGRRVHRAS
ncbi:transposase [Actinacidiphila paucisporea]|uniref:transposase n=1 Tax=Actinacidiphila paucisporea TaxID=310782 RepID=UPI001F2753B9|nr:transposase [Actinacidiphila paucisporea]